MRPFLPNRMARAVFLDAHHLWRAPQGAGKGADLLGLITDLGFVQVDSVNTVERAHHMILFARRPAYRPKHLAPLLEHDRSLFEHWTHDAAVIPTAFFPQWRLKHARDAQRLSERWPKWRREGYQREFQTVLDHIDADGPVCSADVGADETRGSGGWWDWHPSKTALEYLWRDGTLSITRRQAFRKFYDRTENVIPDAVRNAPHDAAAARDWFCNAALDRLGFATSGEIAAFWDVVPPDEAKDWCRAALSSGAAEEIEIGLTDGSRRRVLARPDLIARAEALPSAGSRMRVLSPFDPALRDRKRAERLFGFHYRIEIFTPAPKRRFGYYVFPLLEGDRLVGRIDMKANRRAGILDVTALWPEPGARWTDARQARLEAELARLCRFAGLDSVRWPGMLLHPYPA